MPAPLLPRDNSGLPAPRRLQRQRRRQCCRVTRLHREPRPRNKLAARTTRAQLGTARGGVADAELEARPGEGGEGGGGGGGTTAPRAKTPSLPAGPASHPSLSNRAPVKSCEIWETPPPERPPEDRPRARAGRRGVVLTDGNALSAGDDDCGGIHPLEGVRLGGPVRGGS